MVYRYRVVRTDQVAQHMIAAPTMPLYGGPVGASLDKLRGDMGALRRKLAAAGAPVPAASGADAASASADAAAPFTSPEAEAQAEADVTPAMNTAIGST